MRRNVDDFRELSIRDLHDEIIGMSLGDGWDGMVSKGLRIEINAAEEAWEEKMKELDEIIKNKNQTT